ncbi:unnamed protein product [Symbiodinium sp. CCMP2592]|nr:unnamed protein product [Symbiodinium sp. CCMP2592]
MPWPIWEVRARHVDKNFRQCDEFSQALLVVEKIQSFATILPKFFDYEKDADHRTPDCDMLKISAYVVSFNYGLKRRVLKTFRNADCSWMSTRARVAEATNRAEVIKSDCEGREENELRVQGLELFFRFQNDEAGKRKADIVKEIFKLMPMGRDTNRAGRCWSAWPRFPPASTARLSADGVPRIDKSEATDSVDNKYRWEPSGTRVPVGNTSELIAP